MRATKIKMKPGCGTSNNLSEIDEVYIIDRQQERFYKKDVLYDWLQENPETIQVNIYPYPNCIPMTSIHGEKYIQSSPNKNGYDNLLCLPRVY